jgi:hypothetical protein
MSPSWGSTPRQTDCQLQHNFDLTLTCLSAATKYRRGPSSGVTLQSHPHALEILDSCLVIQMLMEFSINFI